MKKAPSSPTAPAVRHAERYWVEADVRAAMRDCK